MCHKYVPDSDYEPVFEGLTASLEEELKDFGEWPGEKHTFKKNTQ